MESVENLKVLTKSGLRPKAPQILLTLSVEIPLSLAIERVDQWVFALGLLSKVLVTISSALPSEIVRGFPGRGASTRPLRRCLLKRSRHFPTVTLVIFNLLAISRFGVPL